MQHAEKKAKYLQEGDEEKHQQEGNRCSCRTNFSQSATSWPCDLTIICKDGKVGAHAVLLCLKSPVFKIMLEGDTVREFPLSEFDVETVSFVMRVLEGTEFSLCRKGFHDDLLEHVLLFGFQYQIQALKFWPADCLIPTVFSSVIQVLQRRRLAQQTHAGILERQCCFWLFDRLSEADCKFWSSQGHDLQFIQERLDEKALTVISNTLRNCSIKKKHGGFQFLHDHQNQRIHQNWSVGRFVRLFPNVLKRVIQYRDRQRFSQTMSDPRVRCLSCSERIWSTLEWMPDE